MSSCARVIHQEGRGHFLIGRHALFWVGWKMEVRSMENVDYGKCGVWKVRSMENAEYTFFFTIIRQNGQCKMQT